MTATTATTATTDPILIDTQLASLHGRHAVLNRELSTLIDDIRSFVLRDTKVWQGGRRVWTTRRTRDEILTAGNGTAYGDKAVQITAELADIETATRELNTIYNAAPWSRFFLVTSSDGHIHSSMNCSTTYPTTGFAWRPELSGKSEQTAVAELGPFLCSVCFPSAPVEHKLNRSDVARQQRAPRAAKPAAFIDSIRITGCRQTIKTERAAQIEYVRIVASNVLAVEFDVLQLDAEAAETILSALAQAAGVTVEAKRAELAAKVDAKVKRDRREGEKHARKLGLI